MGRRVYEVARELDLSTKEVMARLNDAGVEAKSNLSVVDDAAYQRVFGDGSGGAVPNGRPEAREDEALPRTIRRSRERSPVLRALAYVLVAALAFVLAVGVGAVAALVL
jgi:Translation initiation factor IF-2, N-terminal region